MSDRRESRGLSWPLRFDGSGHLRRSSGKEKIRESVQLAVSTDIGSRVRRMVYGVPLRSAVFRGANDPVATALLQAEVRRLLAANEPRIQVISVEVTPEPETKKLRVRVRYVERVTGSNDTTEAEVELP
jgi:phage baseplate assembly protein W